MQVMGRQKLVWRLDLFSEGAGAIYAARLSQIGENNSTARVPEMVRTRSIREA